MNTFARANLLGLYALALAALVMPMPWDLGPLLQRIALIVLAVHVVELVFVFKHVKAYAGPLFTSVVLTLLFGLLHWMPIAKQQKAGQ